MGRGKAEPGDGAVGAFGVVVRALWEVCCDEGMFWAKSIRVLTCAKGQVCTSVWVRADIEGSTD